MQIKMRANAETMREAKWRSDYLMLFRGKDWDEGLPPEEVQRLMDKVIAWHNGLVDGATCRASSRWIGRAG